MKKIIMLLVTIISMGAFPIVVNAQCVESNRVIEVKQDLLDDMLRIAIINCTDETEEKLLWGQHEEIGKMDEEELNCNINAIYQILPKSKQEVLEDVDEDGNFSDRDILEYLIKNLISSCDENSAEQRELWGLHEEVKKLTLNEITEYLEQLSGVYMVE